MKFPASEFLPAALLARITDIRVHAPHRALQAAQERRRRLELAPNGKLNLVAADHAGRRVTAAAGNALAMANRHDFLARIVRILMSPRVDGVLATMDLLEDLLIVHDLYREVGGPAFLDGKILLAAMNRGGLAGSCWEMEDAMTGASPQTCAQWRLDGAKILLRVCDTDRGSLATLTAAAKVISEMNSLRLPIFVDPLPVVRTESGFRTEATPEALAKIACVAAALGESSHMLWLNLPNCENFEVVAGATTLPILMLGGESGGDPRPFLHGLHQAMKAGPSVRGSLVGRSVLFPADEDPLVIGEAMGQIIYGGLSVDAALEAAAPLRGSELDYLSALAAELVAT